MHDQRVHRTFWWEAGVAVLFLSFAAGPLAGQLPTDGMAAEWCPEPEARQFDFWVGDWDVDNRASPPNSDRFYDVRDATNHVYTVVGGCAIVEHWRGYAFQQAGHIVGYSVRAYDPGADRWELVLLWPISGPPRFGNPSGRFENGRGDFYNQFVNPNGDTVWSRLSFWNIEDDTFQWNNGISVDGGMTWDSSWIMLQSRRPRTAPGLWNGTAVTVDRCPDEVYRAFDPYLGEWTGTRVGPDGDSTAVRTHILPILEGCAVQERTMAEDGSWEAYRVRAYEPHMSAWVEYAVASDRRKLVRREATGDMGAVVFTDVEPAAGTLRRTRWVMDGEGIHRVEEESGSADGPWRLVAETTFPARVSGRSGPPR